MCKITKELPNQAQIEHAIRRNFGGFDKKKNDETFKLFNAVIPSTSKPDRSIYYDNYRISLRDEFKESDHVRRVFFELYTEKHTKKLNEEFALTLDSKKTDSDQQFKKYNKEKFRECLQKDDFEDDDINEKFEDEYSKYFERRFNTEVQ